LNIPLLTRKLCWHGMTHGWSPGMTHHPKESTKLIWHDTSSPSFPSSTIYSFSWKNLNFTLNLSIPDPLTINDRRYLSVNFNTSPKLVDPRPSTFQWLEISLGWNLTLHQNFSIPDHRFLGIRCFYWGNENFAKLYWPPTIGHRWSDIYEPWTSLVWWGNYADMAWHMDDHLAWHIILRNQPCWCGMTSWF
jgi:hypothetical protein